MLDRRDLFIPKVFYRVEVRTLCRPVKFIHMQSHVGTGRGHPQTVPTKLGAWNCPSSLAIPEFLSLELRGQDKLLKNNPTPIIIIIPPLQKFTLGKIQSDKYCSSGNHQTQTGPSDCQMEKHDSSLQSNFYDYEVFTVNMNSSLWVQVEKC